MECVHSYGHKFTQTLCTKKTNTQTTTAPHILFMHSIVAQVRWQFGDWEMGNRTGQSGCAEPTNKTDESAEPKANDGHDILL